MKCRRINPENGMVVWFGVKDVSKVYNNGQLIEYELDSIFQNDNDKHDNYAEGSEAVANSLRQRLSVIKHELWYDYERGLPLIDKVRNKATIDAYVVEKVLEHPDVIDIEGFASKQERNAYSCYLVVNTKYGQIELGM